MKKFYIVLAVAATAMLLTSCEEELSFNDVTLGKDEIAFSFSNVTTKAATNLPTAVKGISVPVGVDARGDAIFLEETIEEMNPSPATKGAPAYTINLGNLYPKLGVYADGGNFGGDVVFEKMDGSTYDRKDGNSEGWRYKYGYPSNPWPKNADEDVDFYLRLPAESAAEDFDYTTQGAIGFHYSSAENGEDQQDLLFGFTSISKNDHDAYRPNGAPVEMLHALTGVRFRSASHNDHETKTIITKVEISGLAGSGDCVITPSSKSVVWDELGNYGTYILEFENADYSREPGVDGTVNFEKGTNPKFGDSWYSAAADRNLNNEDGELTFWFIPQEMTDNVKLKVTFCVKTPDTSGASGGGYETHEIELGKLINAERSTPVKWEAGQLRTYTLDPKLVDVEIYDSMVGLTKSGLHVTNTGNVDEFVRMMVIGNWYGWASQDDADAGKEPMILVGYTHPEPSNTEMVKPWFREDEEYGAYFDSSFTGGKPKGDNKWIFGTGSYFYYPDPIGPDAELAESSALFQNYTLPANKIPTIYIPTSSSSTRVQAVGVHLVMEVVIQAIAAQKPDSEEEYTWQEAWSAATGETIGVKE